MAGALLNSPQPSIEAVIAALINALQATDQPVVLVLDDYHVIDAREVHESVAFLLDHRPANVHLVIATRADPPLPLARMRVRGELREIRAADLRFTSDEIAEYFDESMGFLLSDADLRHLEGRTEGWIAALQLAAISMQGRDDVAGFVAAFAGDDRFVLDYLVGEVLDRQSPEVRAFLLETSVLSRFTAALCDAVTGRTDSRAMLEHLDRANPFIVPLDDRRTWFRYHHLFADVLRAHLGHEMPARASELHLRAGEWHADNDDPVEAIGHAMAGGHVDLAARLIELTAPDLRRNRQEATLRRWLEALPGEVLERRPVLAVCLAGACMASGETTRVVELLQLAVSASEDTTAPPIVFDRAEFERMPAQILVYRAALALLGSDVADATAHADGALALADPGDHVLRGAATALLGLACWAEGDLATAERHYGEAVDHFVTADHLPDMLGCSLALADIQMAQGRLGAATRTLEAGLTCTTEHIGLRGAADMHVGLSEVLIERNDLEAAARHLGESAELGERGGLPQHAYRRRVTAARLHRARGELHAALALIDEAEPLYDTDFSPPVRPVSALRARVQLACGELDAAVDWATQRGLHPDDDLEYVREIEHITLARVLLARHAVEDEARLLRDAASLLERLLRAAEEGGRTGSAIEILVLLAAARRAGGDVASAEGHLEDALARAEPEGHVRVFLHAGPEVAALLESIAAQGRGGPHAGRVAAAMGPERGGSGPESSAGSRLVDELSARELEVLRLLRSDLSGPEIARELLVSLNTLRTHTKHIYAKLGVNSRREATSRAAELGL